MPNRLQLFSQTAYQAWALGILPFRLALWRKLDRDATSLCLDLFTPIPLETLEQDEEEDFAQLAYKYTASPAHLFPLTDFHHLRYLALYGMLQSYQDVIWQTCWQAPNLETLILEMALEPIMLPSAKSEDIPTWRKIDKTWSFSHPSAQQDPLATPLTTDSSNEPLYLGAHGGGTLHDEFGDGEYLDALAIATTRSNIEFRTMNLHLPDRLPIRKLVLAGFVVDANPFLHWFSPNKLQKIVFKDHCIDAGFGLHEDMCGRVDVCFGGTGTARWIDATRDVTVVSIEPKHRGRYIEPYHDLGTEKFINTTDAAAAAAGDSSDGSDKTTIVSLRKKLSGLLPRLKRAPSMPALPTASQRAPDF